MKTAIKSDTKADYILEKGMEILWANGYNGTSVNDIVRAANIPKGSFYFYFKSKEDFAVKALEFYFNSQFSEALDILNDESFSPKQRIFNFMEDRIKMLKEKLDCKMGCMASNLGSEMSEHSEKIRKVILEKETQLKTKLIDLAEQAKKDGDINELIEVPAMIEFITNAAKGAMITMKEMKDSFPVDNHFKMVKYLLR